MTDLKPCPVCGSEAEYYESQVFSPSRVYCPECGIQLHIGLDDDRSKLIARWNALPRKTGPEKFTNTHGTFVDGDHVWFRVENQSLWSGDTDGTLRHVRGEWIIETKRSGIVTINKGYDAYLNSIEHAM